MARLPKDSLFGALQGALGKEIVFKQYHDKIVVSKYPDMSKVKPSPLQLEGRNRMREAVAYARSVLRDPVKKAAMEKTLGPGETVYHKAKKQYFEERKKGWKIS